MRHVRSNRTLVHHISKITNRFPPFCMNPRRKFVHMAHITLSVQICLGNDQIGPWRKRQESKRYWKGGLSCRTHHHCNESADVALFHDKPEGLHRRVHTHNTERLGNLGKLNIRRVHLVNTAVQFHWNRSMYSEKTEVVGCQTLELDYVNHLISSPLNMNGGFACIYMDNLDSISKNKKILKMYGKYLGNRVQMFMAKLWKYVCGGSYPFPLHVYVQRNHKS